MSNNSNNDNNVNICFQIQRPKMPEILSSYRCQAKLAEAHAHRSIDMLCIFTVVDKMSVTTHKKKYCGIQTDSHTQTDTCMNPIYGCW